MSHSKTSRTLNLPYPKDENGKPLCRWCRGAVLPPRTCWCSAKCVQDYEDRYDSKHQRRQVKKRDKGVCAMCSLDTTKFREELKRLYREAWPQDSYIHQCLLEKAPLCLEYLAKHGMTLKDVKFTSRGMADFWQADHTVPVIEGGGGVHWNELRTLCSACHRKETKALAGRRAEQRKKEKNGE